MFGQNNRCTITDSLLYYCTDDLGRYDFCVLLHRPKVDYRCPLCTLIWVSLETVAKTDIESNLSVISL